MKKKNHLFILLFLILTHGYSAYFKIEKYLQGQPFLLLYINPARIVMQEGIPIGISYYYSRNTTEQMLVTGFSEKFAKTAYALAYTRKGNTLLQNNINNFSSAFSFIHEKLSVGSSFHFLFIDHEPIFLADLALSLHFQDNFYLGMVLNNIVLSDTTQGVNYQGVKLTNGGILPLIKKLSYNAEVFIHLHNLNVSNIKNLNHRYGGILEINKLFFNDPYLSVTVHLTYFNNKEKESEFIIHNSLGYQHSINKYMFHLKAGLAQSIFSKEIIFSVTSAIKISFTNRIQNLSCDLGLTNSLMTPDGNGVNDFVVIQFKGKYTSKKVRVKKWTFLITSGEEPRGHLVKMFSGGNIPPSSLIWDGRNAKNELVKKGVYYLQLLIIDTLDRVISSPIKSLEIQ